MVQVLRWFGHVQRMEGNRIHKRVLYMNLETTRLRGRPGNRWQDEVREDGRIVGGEGWQEKIYNREEWKKSSWERQGIVAFCTCQWAGWMVQVELNNMYINIGANNGSEKLWTKKNTATSGKLINPLNSELNPICCLLALLGAHHFLHVSRIRVKSLTLRLLMSYIYIYIYIYVCVCVCVCVWH